MTPDKKVRDREKRKEKDGKRKEKEKEKEGKGRKKKKNGAGSKRKAKPTLLESKKWGGYYLLKGRWRSWVNPAVRAVAALDSKNESKAVFSLCYIHALPGICLCGA